MHRVLRAKVAILTKGILDGFVGKRLESDHRSLDHCRLLDLHPSSSLSFHPSSLMLQPSSLTPHLSSLIIPHISKPSSVSGAGSGSFDEVGGNRFHARHAHT